MVSNRKSDENNKSGSIKKQDRKISKIRLPPTLRSILSTLSPLYSLQTIQQYRCLTYVGWLGNNVFTAKPIGNN